MTSASSGSESGEIAVPSEVQNAVLVKSEPMPADSVQVRGHDFREVSVTGCLRMGACLRCSSVKALD